MTTTPPRRTGHAPRRLLGLAASIGLLATACGADDDAASVTTPTTVAPTTTAADLDVFTETDGGESTDAAGQPDAAPSTAVATTVDPAAADPAASTLAPDPAPVTDSSAPDEATITTVVPAATAAPDVASTGTADTIPEAVRGTWRESEADSVTAAECDDVNDSANTGRVLTVRADGFSVFEEGGRLLTVYSSDDTRIDALFDTSYAEPSEDRFTFETTDGGDVLLVREAERPDSIRYVRCPT